MGFLDKARATASELAAKADTALASSGLGGPGAEADKYLRDLGVLTYLEANGRAVSPDDRERVMEALRAMEARGEIRSFALHTAVAAAGTVPPPPGAATPPPAGPPAAPVAEERSEPITPSAPPPPPPSWMRNGES